MAFSWVWIFNRWNLLDTLIIFLTGVLVMWVMEPLGIDPGLLRACAVIRVVRMVRPISAMKGLKLINPLWILVQGILSSVHLLVWAMIILGVIHYMFAIAMIEVVAKSEQYVDDEYVQEFFGSIARACCTFFQIMTLDAWVDKARPLFADMPSSAFIVLLFVGVAQLIFFNVMTAIVVQKTFKARQTDGMLAAINSEQHYIKTVRELMSIFKDLDEDNSGELSKAEFTDTLTDVAFLRRIRMLDIDPAELPDIFEVLDDGDGAVTSEEFVMGMMRMSGSAMSRDMLAGSKKMTDAAHKMSDLATNYYDASTRLLDSVESDLKRSHSNLLQAQAMTAEFLKKLDAVGLGMAVRKSTVKMKAPALPSSEDREVIDARLADEVAAAVENPALKHGKVDSILPTGWTFMHMQARREAELKKVKDRLRKYNGMEDLQSNSGNSNRAKDFKHMGTLSLNIDRFSREYLRDTAKVPKEALLMKPNMIQQFPAVLVSPPPPEVGSSSPHPKAQLDPTNGEAAPAETADSNDNADQRLSASNAPGRTVHWDGAAFRTEASDGAGHSQQRRFSRRQTQRGSRDLQGAPDGARHDLGRHRTQVL